MSDTNLTYDQAKAEVENGGGAVFATYSGIFPAYLELHSGAIWITGKIDGSTPGPYSPTDEAKTAHNWIAGGDQPPR